MTIEYRKWWLNHSELIAYARHLVSVHDLNAVGLLAYFEKPWKWEAAGVSFKPKDDWCPECPKED